MKRNTIALLLFGVLIAAALGACNNNNGRGNATGANIGAIPTTTCLLSPNGYQGLCNYNYQGSQGFWNYDYTLYMNGLNNNYASGFCGCGQNGFPVYNNNWGLGCVDYSYIQQNNPYNSTRYLMFTWNASTLQWSSTQPYYNNYSNYNSCQQSVIMACDTGMQGSCGPNGVCMAMNPYGGTGYSQRGAGICVANPNSYNYPYGY